jgi:hypothetical protein
MSGPVMLNSGAVLAAVNTAFRAARGGGLAASVDRHGARRFLGVRPGRRNAAKPNKETAQQELLPTM